MDTRSVIEPFLQKFCVEKQVREAFETYVDEGYIQHNPAAATGRQPAIAALSAFFDAVPGLSFDIRRVLIDGDLAAVHGHLTLHEGDRGTAVVDIFRVANGKIVEHWDVVQPVPEHAENENTMF